MKVIQPEKPVAKEILAEAIVAIGKAADELHASGLNEKAVIVLLHDYSKVGKPAIRDVLKGLRQLKAWYCR